VLRLVGRRNDAPLVFADAGRRAARYAAKTRSRSSRALVKVSPRGVARRLALRSASRLAKAIFDAELKGRSHTLEVSMKAPVTIVAVPTGEACAFYGSVYQELLRSLTGFEGALVHERCRARGDDACMWRTAAAEVYE